MKIYNRRVKIREERGSFHYDLIPSEIVSTINCALVISDSMNLNILTPGAHELAPADTHFAMGAVL